MTIDRTMRSRSRIFMPETVFDPPSHLNSALASREEAI